jgi:hypothetical protein
MIRRFLDWLFGRRLYDYRQFPNKEPRGLVRFDGDETVAQMIKRLR